MKILLTGGGTGGHFYPLIAVAEEIKRIAEKENLLDPQLYFASVDPYDSDMLLEYDIEFIKIPAGKTRRYFSVRNATDTFRTMRGTVKAIFVLFRIFPDVVFSKGGFASVPVVFVARLFGIPVFIHESDSKPGRANMWAGKFARRIAISYPQAAEYFPKEKVALTGNPIRREMLTPQSRGAHEFLKLEEGTPVILVLGGSSGAQRINNTLLESLPDLVESYQIIHQTGKAHFEEVKSTADVILTDNPKKERYRPFANLNALALKMSAGIADIVITRAGSTLFEVAHWGIPSIVIPIPESVSHDQRTNAFTYARSGAAVVVEEENLSTHILVADIKRLMDDEQGREEMKQAAKEFAKADAGPKIAQAIVDIALEHEKE